MKLSTPGNSYPLIPSHPYRSLPPLARNKKPKKSRVATWQKNKTQKTRQQSDGVEWQSGEVRRRGRGREKGGKWGVGGKGVRQPLANRCHCAVSLSVCECLWHRLLHTSQRTFEIFASGSQCHAHANAHAHVEDHAYVRPHAMLAFMQFIGIVSEGGGGRKAGKAWQWAHRWCPVLSACHFWSLKGSLALHWLRLYVSMPPAHPTPSHPLVSFLSLLSTPLASHSSPKSGFSRLSVRYHTLHICQWFLFSTFTCVFFCVCFIHLQWVLQNGKLHMEYKEKPYIFLNKLNRCQQM